MTVTLRQNLRTANTGIQNSAELLDYLKEAI